MLKTIMYFNRTKEQIVAAYNKLKARWKHLHYGSMRPVGGPFYSGWFIIG